MTRDSRPRVLGACRDTLVTVVDTPNFGRDYFTRDQVADREAMRAEAEAESKTRQRSAPTHITDLLTCQVRRSKPAACDTATRSLPESLPSAQEFLMYCSFSHRLSLRT